MYLSALESFCVEGWDNSMVTFSCESALQPNPFLWHVLPLQHFIHSFPLNWVLLILNFHIAYLLILLMQESCTFYLALLPIFLSLFTVIASHECSACGVFPIIKQVTKRMC